MKGIFTGVEFTNWLIANDLKAGADGEDGKTIITLWRGNRCVGTAKPLDPELRPGGIIEIVHLEVAGRRSCERFQCSNGNPVPEVKR